MEQKSEKSQERILELLRSLPQPGQILIDSVGAGLSGFSLRPKLIPRKITGTSAPYTVNLQLMRNGEVFGEDQSIQLRTQSDEWQRWIKERDPFVIRAEDVGKVTDVTDERESNFNKYLLHEFLDRFTLVIMISKEDRERIVSSDNYPFYFWDKPTCVSGCASSSGNMSRIQAIVMGLELRRAIEISGSLNFKYCHFVPSEKKLLMSTVIKWHKALISLYQLMKRDDIDIPLDFSELEKNCRAEIDAAATSQEV